MQCIKRTRIVTETKFLENFTSTQKFNNVICTFVTIVSTSHTIKKYFLFACFCLLTTGNIKVEKRKCVAFFSVMFEFILKPVDNQELCFMLLIF